MSGAVHIQAVAEARGVPRDGGSEPDYADVGLALLGSCKSCHATVAAYNAYPSRDGWWRCADCITDDLGFPTVDEFERWCDEQAGARRYTLAQLRALDVVRVGQTDDLVIEQTGRRVWLSRLTTEDGAPYDNQVTVEHLAADGSWITVESYEAE